MTITARNYAAQAHRAALNLANDFEIKKHDGLGLIKAIALGLDKSIHFALPDGGKIFDAGFKTIIGNTFRLPFPSITAEFYDQGYKIAILAFEEEANSDVTAVAFCTAVSYAKEPWCFLPFITSIREVHSDGGFSLGCYDKSGWIEPSEVTRQSEVAACAVLELIEALSCSNVTHEPIEKINPSANARRIRDGKLPLYETRCLVIDAGKSVAVGDGIGGTHSSPRQHLRRGHIRRHPSAGNIWVNACVVGHSELGVIEKQYAVV